MDKSSNSDLSTSFRGQKISNAALSSELSVGTPCANALADSLGVSPLYRQIDSARWTNAAQVYHSSRAHSPSIPVSNTFNFDATEQIKSPLSIEEIADMNRGQNKESSSGIKLDENVGPLELEAISALNELAPFVESISVSEILPKTAELIFLNVKTKEDLAFTLELTMKGWRVCSSRNDCMYGDYLNVDFHTRYFHNAKEVLKVISPQHCDCFAESLTEKLKELQKSKEVNFDHDYRKSLSQEDESIVTIPLPEKVYTTEIDDETMFQ